MLQIFYKCYGLFFCNISDVAKILFVTGRMLQEKNYRWLFAASSRRTVVREERRR